MITVAVAGELPEPYAGTTYDQVPPTNDPTTLSMDIKQQVNSDYD